MADQVINITLDKSKPHSECRGERQPDDPHYKVHFWQGQQVGKNYVTLPFDQGGKLVPDDGKTEPWDGMVDGKPVKHHPLYTPAMRDLIQRKQKRAEQLAANAAQAEPETDPVLQELDNAEIASEEVNFAAWLRGEARYEPHLLRTAAKKRYSKNYPQLNELVVDLVLDEKVVAENEVCAALAKFLPSKAA